MEIWELLKQPLQEFTEENIYGAILGQTKHASMTVGVVKPKQSQRLHRQARPDDGDEIVVVLSGEFRVRSGNESGGACYSVDHDGPVVVVIPSGVPGAFENIGDVDVRFFTVFTPPFVMGEIEFLE